MDFQKFWVYACIFLLGIALFTPEETDGSVLLLKKAKIVKIKKALILAAILKAHSQGGGGGRGRGRGQKGGRGGYGGGGGKGGGGYGGGGGGGGSYG